jgi:class 3 adenylate cyclase
MESDSLRPSTCRKRIGHDASGAVNGEDAMVTVLFVDKRHFTRFAASARAREAVVLLNEFFGVVVPVLESHGGHASKFLGDGARGHVPAGSTRDMTAAVEGQIERFAPGFRERVLARAQSSELRAVVGETLQPAHVSLWLRAGRP